MTMKAKRENVQMAGTEIEVFQLPKGDYILSQAQLASPIEVNPVLALRFLQENHPEAFSDKGYWNYKIESFKDSIGRGGNRKINAVSIEIASEFWMAQAFKGNVKAQALVAACMQEALQRRCDAAFNVTKTEQQYEQQAIVSRESWEQARHYLRESHCAFTLACLNHKFNPAQTHDLITIAVCGMRASELRELDVIEGAFDVGLNHIENLEAMNKVARVKINFARYKKGTPQERIIRALKDAKEELIIAVAAGGDRHLIT